jgi:hypothetical protein
MSTVPTETPLRAAVFSTVPEATRVVQGLLAAGFGRERITVVCSEDTKLRYFREFEHQEPAGTYTPASAAAGGTLGALLGGAAALAGGMATGGVALVAAGGLAIWSGAIVGGLLGAMMTRGVEHELANFYDQEVAAGKILVAANTDGDASLMDAAERIFHAEDKDSMPLREG